MKETKKNDREIVLLLLLLLGLGGFYFLTAKDAQPTAIEIQGTKEHTDRVNVHLFKTSQEMLLERQKIEWELRNAMKSPGPRGPSVSPQVNSGLDYSVEDQPVTRELKRGEPSVRAPSSPKEIVQDEVLAQQEALEASDAYMKDYFAQTIENARKKGWALELNEDGTVRSLKALKPPAQNIYDSVNGNRAAQ